MKITRLTGEEVLTLAKRSGAIGKYDRKWSFFRTESGGRTLLPNSGPYYLYRGQTRRHVPCFPAMYRHFRHSARFLHQLSADDAMAIVANVARTFRYYAELDHHPVFRWARARRLDINALEIAQHYGIPSSLLDLSESIEVALFFATHEVHPDRGFEPLTKGTGILYIVPRTMLPLPFMPRFRPVAIQPFLRPFRQWAWACELLMGECFEACPYLALIEFDHSRALADEIRSMAEAEGPLFPPDLLSDLADAVNALRILPERSVASATRHLGSAYPMRKFGDVRDALRKSGYRISANAEPIIGKDTWTQWEPRFRLELESWQAFAVQHIEQLCVRGGRGTGKPLEWGIGGKPTDRFWSRTPENPVPLPVGKILLNGARPTA